MSVHGKHLIGGQWVSSNSSFSSRPVSGPSHQFCNATRALVDDATSAAEIASHSFGNMSRASRAVFLRAIAEELETRGEELTAIGCAETGLPAARLIGERARTVGQLNMFGDLVATGEELECTFDAALPDRDPLPRPDLRRMMRPIGPVAVFGASNFPLAFSTAGGDTASALAAGCPVIVKGHPAHPGTSDIVAQAVLMAMDKLDIDPGVFSLLQDSGVDAAQHLVLSDRVSAVGFTGSTRVGRQLFDLCAARENPIPFFGEMGSINPVLVLPGALRDRATEIANGWIASLTLGVGQFCTKPGIVVIPSGDIGQQFVAAAKAAVEKANDAIMLSDTIATKFRDDTDRLSTSGFAERIHGRITIGRQGGPTVFTTTVEHWYEQAELSEEVFGPFGLIVTAKPDSDYCNFVQSLCGQLTISLHIDSVDNELAARILPVAEKKAGRLIVNGFPTGVEVADSMVHGGPYPASTSIHSTSVGSLAVRRFLRPVCYQDVPQDLLPNDLRSNV